MGADQEETDNPYTEEEQKLVAEMEASPMKAELKWLDKRKSDKGKTYYTETKDGKNSTLMIVKSGCTNTYTPTWSSAAYAIPSSYVPLSLAG